HASAGVDEWRTEGLAKEVRKRYGHEQKQLEHGRCIGAGHGEWQAESGGSNVEGEEDWCVAIVATGRKV
ncbi:hypothetical protein, partial [Burkholderia pseudomallei]|uniref:hypothetical protein n=1 Tax=Burkholderia pseudomallei TaxID=28450 RepID=UPI0021F7ED17